MLSSLLADLWVRMVLLTWSLVSSPQPAEPPPPHPTPVATTVVVASALPQAPLPPAAPVAAAPRVVEGLDAWIAASAWPEALRPTLRRVVLCESGGNPAASNGYHQGLLQVDPYLHGWPPSDPVAQLDQGYAVYLKALAMFGNGWQPWACY